MFTELSPLSRGVVDKRPSRAKFTFPYGVRTMRGTVGGLTRSGGRVTRGLGFSGGLGLGGGLGVTGVGRGR